jgi:hypothetical protein
MKPFFKAMVLSSLSLLSLNASAVGVSIDNQEVRYIATGWGAEGIDVETVAVNSANGCGPRYILSPTHPMKDEMMSILLSAFHTGSKVNLYVDSCINDLMELKSVAILK